jgi:hypothetical protein
LTIFDVAAHAETEPCAGRAADFFLTLPPPIHAHRLAAAAAAAAAAADFLSARRRLTSVVNFL